MISPSQFSQPSPSRTLEPSRILRAKAWSHPAFLFPQPTHPPTPPSPWLPPWSKPLSHLTWTTYQSPDPARCLPSAQTLQWNKVFKACHTLAPAGLLTFHLCLPAGSVSSSHITCPLSTEQAKACSQFRPILCYILCLECLSLLDGWLPLITQVSAKYPLFREASLTSPVKSLSPLPYPLYLFTSVPLPYSVLFAASLLSVPLPPK